MVLAMSILPPPDALGFMNRDNDVLGGRPLDLVLASDHGRAIVIAHLSAIALSAD